jgi:hypothetical protein
MPISIVTITTALGGEPVQRQGLLVSRPKRNCFTELTAQTITIHGLIPREL